MASAADHQPGSIRCGIGGWTYKPWRGTFYPEGLAQKNELGYAARQLATIEVNGTFYRTQKPATFARWAAETPEGFVFSLKAPRYIVGRRDLAGAGEGIAGFIASGITELGDRLGPILWQMPETKPFDRQEWAAFIEHLPAEHDGRRLRHAVELRHASFVCRDAVDICRAANIAIVYADAADYPAIADPTADFIYARLQRGDDAIATGYTAGALDDWQRRALAWSRGERPKGLTLVDDTTPAPTTARDVYVYFIREGKMRAPAAAQALQQRIDRASAGHS